MPKTSKLNLFLDNHSIDAFRFFRALLFKLWCECIIIEQEDLGQYRVVYYKCSEWSFISLALSVCVRAVYFSLNFSLKLINIWLK